MTNTIINNQCSTHRLDTLLTQCKLTTQVSRQLRLPKSDLDLISDFYSATSIESRRNVVDTINQNREFFHRQADLLYRYVDGKQWLKPDFDRLTVGYYTSIRKTENIVRDLVNTQFANGWEVKNIGRQKYYSYANKVCAPSGAGFRLSFCNSKNQANLRHLKLDFSPSYFSDYELKYFFTWLNDQMGPEREQAIDQSLVTSMEIGLQLHQVFSPILIFKTLNGERTDYSWEILGSKQNFIQATYDQFTIDNIGSFTNKVYCPVSKLFNRVFRDRKYTENDARKLMSAISHAARLESVYNYALSVKAKEYSLTELEKVPSYIADFDLISPDEIIEMTSKQKGKLFQEKLVRKQLVKYLDSMHFPSSTIDNERVKMLTKFKTLILS